MSFGEPLRGRTRHTLYNPLVVDPTLVLDLPFSEGVGNIVHDRSLYGNHGTIYGASWVDGKVGRGLSFDGNDYVTVLDDDTLDSLVTSVEFWVNPNLGALDLWGTLVSKSSSQWYVAVYPNGNVFVIYVVDGYRFLGTTVIGGLITNQWTHYAFVTDGATYLNEYINGLQVLQTTTLGAYQIRDTTFDLILGASSPRVARYYFVGLLDEVRVYKRALTANEILRHYNE